MHPFFLQAELPVLGPLDVPSYFLMVTVAFLVGTSLVVRDARREGTRVIDVLDLSLLLLGVGLIGSRLGHVFLESPWVVLPVPKQSNAGWAHYFCRLAGESHETTRPWNLGRYYLLHPQMVFAVWNGGMVFYGGFLAAIPAGWWFCRRRGLAFWKTADLCAPILAAGLAFGRVGCLMAGCCYGRAIEGTLKPFGINSEGVMIYPTQLMESFVALGICWVLYRIRRGKLFDGQVYVALLVLYGIWRPINEYFRGDDQRGLHEGITTSQWISFGLIVAALSLVPYLWRRRMRPSASATAAPPGLTNLPVGV
jgi:phosphatidylglycerol:prolipoprotein diacylglycerol transferase